MHIFHTILHMYNAFSKNLRNRYLEEYLKSDFKYKNYYHPYRETTHEYVPVPLEFRYDSDIYKFVSRIAPNVSRDIQNLICYKLFLQIYG